MNLLGYRAFATELLKIATEVRDAEIRGMIAEGKGKEYAPGGELQSNTEIQTNFKPKLAASFMAFTPVGTYNVRGKAPTATGSPYETTSNFAGTALRGGMTGAGAATLGHTLRHGHDLKLAPKHLGAAVGVGAGVALVDRALRRHSMKKQLSKLAGLKARAEKWIGDAAVRGVRSEFAPMAAKAKRYGKIGLGVGAGLVGLDAAAHHKTNKRLTNLEESQYKIANFSPARQLHSIQTRGDFENKVHNTPLKPTTATVGRDFRLPPQGA